jgi:hypothetical protein
MILLEQIFQSNFCFTAALFSAKTLAGSMTPGSIDGNGVSARFNGLGGIVACTTGYLLLTDSMNNKVRKISMSGAVTTFAGSGTIGSVDGTNSAFNNPKSITMASNGLIYVAGAVIECERY